MVVALAGLGTVTGILSMVLALLTGQPVWVALALYPLVGSTTMLLLAFLRVAVAAPRVGAARLATVPAPRAMGPGVRLTGQQRRTALGVGSRTAGGA